MKQLICDASSLISLSENCMLPVLQKLHGTISFLVPQAVYNEVITKPMKTRRFFLQSIFDKSFI